MLQDADPGIAEVKDVRKRLAGIPEVRLHDLRHTFATRLIESGVDIITLRDLLGHSQSAVTERYTHPNESLKRVAVDALT